MTMIKITIRKVTSSNVKVLARQHLPFWTDLHLPMDLPLIVVPDTCSRSRKHCLDRKQVLHLLGFEDSAARIDEWNPLTLKFESRFEIVRGEITSQLGKASDRIERGKPHQFIVIECSRHGAQPRNT